MMMPRGKTKWGWLLVGVTLLAVPLCGFAGTEVRIVTSDGETLRGQLDADFLEIDTGMARKQIPLGDALSANLREIKLRDGKVVKGKLLLKSMTLSTAAGRITIDAGQISHIDVIQSKAVPAETAPRPSPVKPASPRGTVLLTDGSQLTVEFPGESLSAVTQSGAVQILWSDIAETDLRQVKMRDGDTLKVRVPDKVKVKTRFGPLELTPDNVKSIRFKDLAQRSSLRPWRSPPDDGHPPDDSLSPDSRNLAGKLGLGLNMDLVNLGPGPTAIYGVTDRFYTQASLGGIGGPFGMEVKGGYLFSVESFRPYAGFGLRNVSKGADADYYSGVTPKGTSGFLFGGFRLSLFGNEKFLEYLEFGYSLFHEEQTAKAGGYVEPNPIKWHFATGMVYHFDWDLRLPLLTKERMP